MNVLNLYAGLGGNRRLWEAVNVTAIDNNPEVCEIYADLYPNDVIICADAHSFLEKYANEFDFIWTSPPCPSHSRARYSRVLNKNSRPLESLYPDMRLYAEILFLQHNYLNKPYVVENVISYYKPLIKPMMMDRHFFWTNLKPKPIHIDRSTDNLSELRADELEQFLGIDISKYDLVDKRKFLRNCTHPKIGQSFLTAARNYCVSRALDLEY